MHSGSFVQQRLVQQRRVSCAQHSTPRAQPRAATSPSSRSRGAAATTRHTASPHHRRWCMWSQPLLAGLSAAPLCHTGQLSLCTASTRGGQRCLGQLCRVPKSSSGLPAHNHRAHPSHLHSGQSTLQYPAHKGRSLLCSTSLLPGSSLDYDVTALGVGRVRQCPTLILVLLPQGQQKNTYIPTGTPLSFAHWRVI